MTALHAITLETPDPDAATAFYDTVLGVDAPIRVRHGADPTSGFRGYTLSLIVSQPSTVDLLTGDALAAGATELKPAAKSLWGYGSAIQAPDGAIWTIASSSKKDRGPATRAIDEYVLLLGCSDVKAAKQFYVEHGLTVAKSYGGKYVQFEPGSSAVTLGLNAHKALAKNAGVPQEGTGSHRFAIITDADPFVDLDGFAWETGTSA